MHHRPVGPPLSVRLSAATTGVLLLARRCLGARLTVAALLCAAVTTLVLAVPVVSGGSAGGPEVSLDASSSSASRDAGSPVVMGLDGGAVPSSTFAGTSTGVPRSEEPAPAPATAAGTTGAAPAPPPAPIARSVPPAPVVVPEPAPSTTTRVEKAAPPVAAAAPAATTPATAPTATTASDRADEVLALVNAAREAAGCEPLVADAGLADVARAHSEDMRDRDFFDHVNPDGLDPLQRAEQAGQTDARAENIAFGPATATDVMDEWMNSGHRANILDCELSRLGVGIADGPGGPWWTQLFGV